MRNNLNDDVIWRISFQHHLLFGKHYPDLNSLLNNYLPRLIDSKFDVYFGGHEHLMTHSYINYDMANLFLPLPKTGHGALR